MIRFEHVTKRLGDRNVLDGMNFEVEKGEIFFLLGTSGAGKSVSLKHMVRLMTPDSGKIWIGDDVVSEASGRDLERIRARFGYLFQGGALLEWLTVAENVALPLQEHTQMSPDEINQKVMEKLALVKLAEAGDKYPSEISGGMRKRVGLARAIIRDPEIVLYDEPTSGLDPVTSRTIDELIGSLCEEIGVTSVVVTHDLHSALATATRIGVLNMGQLVELSTPQEFIKSKNEFVRAFLDAQYITKRGEWEDKTGI